MKFLYNFGESETILSGIALDYQSKTIYVADTKNDRIQRFDFSGSHLSNIAGGPTVNEKLEKPQYITTSPNNLYVPDPTSSKIHILNLEGTYLRAINFQDCPVGLAYSNSSNRMVVVDKIKGHVKTFTEQGDLLHSFGTVGSAYGAFWLPSGLALDEQNNIYVAEGANHRVQVFDENGNFLLRFGCYGSLEGQFSQYPVNLAIYDEVVYVCTWDGVVHVWK
eukprot:TRINITY_DN1164_c0_g1_i1.p1 TRINITY_DN1164_c0_g1~~TRINITY_DN1164_c0_g1_i1.p1  ORF type:complete len:221 (-),score=29.87 TRINITY_DN1164_c0_g1_i1:139-801(-)